MTTSTTTTRADGALPAFSETLIRESGVGASQPACARDEPEATLATYSGKGATKISRRQIMNMMVSAAAVTATPAAAVGGLDAHIIDLSAEILMHNGRARQDNAEIARLSAIWQEECRQMSEAAAFDRLIGKPGALSSNDVWHKVGELPESKDCDRLVKAQGAHFAAADALMPDLWSMKAQTIEGRRAKLRVLFEFVLDSRWKYSDEDSDWDVCMLRRLLFEFAGCDLADVFAVQDFPTREIEEPEEAESRDSLFDAIELTEEKAESYNNACAKVAEAEKAMNRWRKRNPGPDETMAFSGEEIETGSYASALNRARGDWVHREVNAKIRAGIGPRKKEAADCWQEFSEAADQVALLPAANGEELRMKALASLRLDNANRSIARSVAANLVTLMNPTYG